MMKLCGAGRPHSLAWRAVSPGPSSRDGVAVTSGTREVTADSGDFHHTIGIALRHMDVELFLGGRLVHDGRVLPGMLQTSGLGERLRAIFRGPYDVLHLHFSRDLIAECQAQAGGQTLAGEV